MAAISQPKTADPGAIELCLWSLRYAVRRKWRMTAVLATMLFNTGLEVVKPWPMVFLIDYVLQGKEKPAELSRLLEWLPGAATTGQLIGLRFCSDEEVTELTRAVLGGELRGREDIKKRIKTWRPDMLRV